MAAPTILGLERQIALLERDLATVSAELHRKREEFGAAEKLLKEVNLVLRGTINDQGLRINAYETEISKKNEEIIRLKANHSVEAGRASTSGQSARLANTTLTPANAQGNTTVERLRGALSSARVRPSKLEAQLRALNDRIASAEATNRSLSLRNMALGRRLVAAHSELRESHRIYRLHGDAEEANAAHRAHIAELEAELAGTKAALGNDMAALCNRHDQVVGLVRSTNDALKHKIAELKHELAQRCHPTRPQIVEAAELFCSGWRTIHRTYAHQDKYGPVEIGSIPFPVWSLRPEDVSRATVYEFFIEGLVLSYVDPWMLAFLERIMIDWSKEGLARLVGSDEMEIMYKPQLNSIRMVISWFDVVNGGLKGNGSDYYGHDGGGDLDSDGDDLDSDSSDDEDDGEEDENDSSSNDVDGEANNEPSPELYTICMDARRRFRQFLASKR